MELLILSPCEALAPFVRAFEILETREEMTRTLLPDTGLVLGFRYAGAAVLIEPQADRPVPDQSLTGLRAVARRMRTTADSGILLAKFHPGGAAAFLDAPLHTLFGKVRALDELLPAEAVAQAAGEIRRAGTPEARVACLERFLDAHRQRTAPDPLVQTALRILHETSGSIRISGLAQELGLSQDALEKRFRRAVGASPKQFASLLRLRRAVDDFRPSASLTDLSLDAGYYDQPHFNRHFRTVAGAAPGTLLRSPDWC